VAGARRPHSGFGYRSPLPPLCSDPEPARGHVLSVRQSHRFEDAEAVWLAALEEAIAQLDDESRELIQARYYQRRPLSEVAASLSSTDRAIEGRLARVREKIAPLHSPTTRHWSP
jgi:RNA polymerase sigma factor (sigma-70 family)